MVGAGPSGRGGHGFPLLDFFHHSGLFLIVVLASSLLAVIFSRNISVPVKKLGGDALVLGQGELGQRIRIKGPAELRDLGQTMNLMAEELSQAKEQLETRIRERTG